MKKEKNASPTSEWKREECITYKWIKKEEERIIGKRMKKKASPAIEWRKHHPQENEEESTTYKWMTGEKKHHPQLNE